MSQYLTYHAKTDQTRKRAKRNAARNKMVQLGMASKGDGKDIDHIKPLRNFGTNDITNLRATSPKVNRNWRGKL
jgi:hypothetical protein